MNYELLRAKVTNQLKLFGTKPLTDTLKENLKNDWTRGEGYRILLVNLRSHVISGNHAAGHLPLEV
ncbi:hypothetical protein A8L34_03330 [Bacillus sp. FJAT-27264]|nr:hypothetical protein A8L34_03330 [Bacillus sp. FJAT-27264]